MKPFATRLLFAAMALSAVTAVVAQQQPGAPVGAQAAPTGTAATGGPAPAPTTPAAAPAAAAPAASVVAATPGAKPDVAAGQAKYTAVCAACHGADGNSAVPAQPKLAQQHPEYLVKQLQEYKTGKRQNAIMQGFASQLSDADMKNISYWVAGQKAKPGFARDKALVEVGERIWRGGIADRQIAACAGCHSPNGAGIPSQYPRLSGQHAEYTSQQLVKFRTAGNDPKAMGDSARRNSTQMSQVAAKMNDAEIRAVSDYIAGLR